MASASLVHNVDGPGRRTHVLVVGIGAYDFLNAGTGPLARDHFGLGQLTSPPASARAVADWFIDQFDCVDRPLGSVRLVLSEAVPTPYVNPVTSLAYQPPEGDRAGIVQAIRDWAEAAQDPDDQLILYFCGHGLAGGLGQIYPLKDFGDPANDPFDNALNLQKLATGLATTRASNQLLVMDACRDQDDLLTANPNEGTGAITARPGNRFDINQSMAQCIIHSTELDGAARGQPGQPSLCATAFVRALSGAAAAKSGGVWHVKSSVIPNAITELQARAFAEGSSNAQKGDAGRYVNLSVRRLGGPPTIPVFVRRSDGVSLAGTRLQCRPSGAASWTVDEDVVAAEWEGALQIGEHEFTLKAGGTVVCPPVFDFVVPIYVNIDLVAP